MKVIFLLLACVIASFAQSGGLTQEELTIQEAIQAGDLEGASRLIDQAIRQHPGDGGLVNLRGIVHAQRNEMPEARKDFSEAVRLAPGLIPAWQNLARACQMEADRDASASACAKQAWERVLHAKPDDAESHGSLALLMERQGQFANSLEQLSELASGDAERTENLAVRCVDLARLGRISEANDAAKQLAGREDFSEQNFEAMSGQLESVKTAPIEITLAEGLDFRHAASTETLKQLAIAYERAGRIADARKTLERVAVADPNNAAHLLELARLADQSKDYKGALGYLGHARELEPNNAQIHFLFAQEAAALNLPVEARRSLERALALDPANPSYNYAMGATILSTRDAASAATYFQKFVSARPADPRGQFSLGVAYFASGDYDKAKAQMLRVENEPKIAAEAEYFLGRIARLEGDIEGAQEHLKKSISLMPSFSESHTELGRVFLMQGKLDEAHAELDRAVQLDPNSFEGNSQLLVLYKKTHDPRAEQQAEVLKKLDEERSRRAELMLRTVEIRP